MSIYIFKDSNLKDGFFSRLKSDKVTNKVELVRSYETKDGKKNKTTQLTGNILPGVERLKRAQWDESRHRWSIDATEQQLSEWAHQLGAVDKDNRFIERVSMSNQKDPFITSIKIKISDDYTLDDETTLGKLHKAVLMGRRDVSFGNDDDHITDYDRRYKVEYVGMKLGEKVESEDVLDVDDMRVFMDMLTNSTLEKKAMILESLGVQLSSFPEEKIVNNALYKKWSDEGNKKVGYNLHSSETNKTKIDRLFAATTGDLETEYIISKGIINKLIMWRPDFKYYEFLDINVGRNIASVEEYFRDDKSSDMFAKLAEAIKKQEMQIKKGIKKTK